MWVSQQPCKDYLAMISALQMRNGDMSGELPFPELHSWEVERTEL